MEIVSRGEQVEIPADPITELNCSFRNSLALARRPLDAGARRRGSLSLR